MVSFPRVSLLLCAALLTLASARGESARFELRGILDLGGSQSFNLHDLETGAIQWVEVGRGIGGFLVEEYDAADKTLTLKSGEKTLILSLKESDDIPLGVIGKATASAFEESVPKRPPRPKDLGQASEATPGALNGNQSRSDGGSMSNARSQASIVDSVTRPIAAQTANAATGRAKGQLSYDLKVRPPLRIESIGYRTAPAN